MIIASASIAREAFYGIKETLPLNTITQNGIKEHNNLSSL